VGRGGEAALVGMGRVSSRWRATPVREAQARLPPRRRAGTPLPPGPHLGEAQDRGEQRAAGRAEARAAVVAAATAAAERRCAVQGHQRRRQVGVACVGGWEGGGMGDGDMGRQVATGGGRLPWGEGSQRGRSPGAAAPPQHSPQRPPPGHAPSRPCHCGSVPSAAASAAHASRWHAPARPHAATSAAMMPLRRLRSSGPRKPCSSSKIAVTWGVGGGWVGLY
jgi:hypothetical protein